MLHKRFSNDKSKHDPGDYIAVSKMNLKLKFCLQSSKQIIRPWSFCPSLQIETLSTPPESLLHQPPTQPQPQLQDTLSTFQNPSRLKRETRHPILSFHMQTNKPHPLSPRCQNLPVSDKKHLASTSFPSTCIRRTAPNERHRYPKCQLENYRAELRGASGSFLEEAQEAQVAI